MKAVGDSEGVDADSIGVAGVKISADDDLFCTRLPAMDTQHSLNINQFISSVTSKTLAFLRFEIPST